MYEKHEKYEKDLDLENVLRACSEQIPEPYPQKWRAVASLGTMHLSDRADILANTSQTIHANGQTEDMTNVAIDLPFWPRVNVQAKCTRTVVSNA